MPKIDHALSEGHLGTASLRQTLRAAGPDPDLCASCPHASARGGAGVVVVMVGGAALLLPGWIGIAARHEDGEGLVRSSPGSTVALTMGPDHPGAVWSCALFLCPWSVETDDCDDWRGSRGTEARSPAPR